MVTFKTNLYIFYSSSTDNWISPFEINALMIFLASLVEICFNVSWTLLIVFWDKGLFALVTIDMSNVISSSDRLGRSLFIVSLFSLCSSSGCVITVKASFAIGFDGLISFNARSTSPGWGGTNPFNTHWSANISELADIRDKETTIVSKRFPSWC